MSRIELISPIDGSVYLKREIMTRDAAFAAAASARAAQKAWSERPLEERVDLVRKAGAIVGSTTDRMATELAHQMGRPVRYGGEYRGFNERLTYMADIAGLDVQFQEDPDNPLAARTVVVDNARRRELAGGCRVKWRDGMRRMLAARHPEIKLKT